MAEPAPTIEPVQAPTPAPAPGPTVETPTTSLLYGDETPAPAEPVSEEKPEEPAKPEGGDETEEHTISTVAELIEQSQFDPEWFNSLKLEAKVNGKTTPVTISDLLKSYQIGEAAESRLEEAKTHAKALTGEVAQQKEVLTSQLSSVASLMKEAEALLDKDEAGVNWADLREKDPGEHAAKKLEIKERREHIQSLKEKGAQAWRESVQANQQKSQDDFKQKVAAEKTALFEAIPEWKDPEKAKVEVPKMTDHLVSKYGFTKEEVSGTIDHRLLAIGRDSMLYHELQSKNETAKKKIVKIPKVLRPGPSTPPKPKESSILTDLYG